MPIKRKMRVLMSADTVGGVWTYALELSAALDPYGVEVFLATMGGSLRPDQKADAATVPNLTVFESTFRLEWMEDSWNDVHASGEWLQELERAVHPDLIHLNGYAHASLPWRLPVLITGHSCVYSWYEAVHGTSPPSHWQRYYTEVQRGLRHASAVTAPTHTMLDSLERIYGKFNGVQPIPNARRSDQFGARIKAPVILSAGRMWDEAKNAALLDSVASRLPWPVLLAGETHHPDNGDASFNVKTLGYIGSTELAREMGRASIFALPARYEPFGLSALEAALSGCALVLGDIPSLREVWGDAALYVNPDDAEALEEALMRLIREPAIRETMARRARRRAIGYTPARMARAYRSLYDGIATVQPRPTVTRSFSVISP